MNKVDSLDVKAWAASITRNGSSATVVNRAVGILAGILDDAVEHGHWLSIRHVGSARREAEEVTETPCLSHRGGCVPVGRGVRLPRRPGADPRIYRVAGLGDRAYCR